MRFLETEIVYLSFEIVWGVEPHELTRMVGRDADFFLGGVAEDAYGVAGLAGRRGGAV